MLYMQKIRNRFGNERKKNFAAIQENRIVDVFNIDQTYEKTSMENNGEYSSYSYIKEYRNGLQNPFESVKITCNIHTGDVVIATKFDHEPNSTIAEIDEDEAILAAAQSEYYAAGSAVTSCRVCF